MSTVPISTARSLALFSITSKSSLAIGDSNTSPFLGSRIQEDPIIIYDLLGTPLFYDFMFYKANRLVGRVRASAESDLNSPVYFIEPIQDFPDLDVAEKRAKDMLLSIEKLEIISDSLLVCYCYPKLGILLKYIANGEDKAAIYDIFEDRIVSSFLGEMPDAPEAGSDTQDEFEGILVHSIMQDLLTGSEEYILKRKKMSENSINNIIFLAREILPESGNVSDLNFAGEDYALLEKYFGEHPPAIQSTILPVKLIAQQTPVYCAIASAKMILDYYGFNFTQDTIAEAMKVGTNGTTNSDQISGYRQLSSNKLIPEYDSTPSFDEAVKKVESFEPIKSGVPGHARVCCGWKKYIYFSPITAEISTAELWLLINDPYPVGQGSQRWENIDNHNYNNFIYLSRWIRSHDK
jgi:hypothetical protein